MTNTSKTIVFFGNEKLATGIAGVNPVILHAVEAAGFVVEQHITSPLSDLQPHKAQLGILAAYGHIIPQHVLDEFPLGIINIHPSLLPMYRGSTPIEQAMLDGIRETGVSIMRLTVDMDEGPLYAQEKVPLAGSESKQELTEALQYLGAQLLTDVLHTIADGSLQPSPQTGTPTYTRRLTKTDSALDFAKSATQLEREIRAYQGWPKSRTTLGTKEVVITKAHVSSNRATQMDIMCGDGKYLSIDELIAPSGRTMSAAAFLNGYTAV